MRVWNSAGTGPRPPQVQRGTRALTPGRACAGACWCSSPSQLPLPVPATSLRPGMGWGRRGLGGGRRKEAFCRHTIPTCHTLGTRGRNSGAPRVSIPTSPCGPSSPSILSFQRLAGLNCSPGLTHIRVVYRLAGLAAAGRRPTAGAMARCQTCLCAGGGASAPRINSMAVQGNGAGSMRGYQKGRTQRQGGMRRVATKGRGREATRRDIKQHACACIHAEGPRIGAPKATGRPPSYREARMVSRLRAKMG